ncbi:TniQ family protein [Rhizobium sp. GCM10022189]|uniref:TniQ family protein n=1 Tax=Rhizobium sp. GCM10022189 TaxID=3252654 RepID=UPI00361B1233
MAKSDICDIPRFAKGLLRVPFFEDELLTSFVSRMARANGRLSMNAFCSDLGLKADAIATGNGREIAKLAVIFGYPEEELISRRLVGDTDRVARSGGERLPPRLDKLHLRVCPDCLSDDEQEKSRMPGTRQYARAVWLLADVGTCTRHGLELTALPYSSLQRKKSYDFCLLVDDFRGRIQQHARTGNRRIPTLLETFIMDRLAGKRAHGGILDNLDLDAGIELCRILGSAVVGGRRSKMAEAGEDPNAVNLAFRALRHGGFELELALKRIANERGNGIETLDWLYRELRNREPPIRRLSCLVADFVGRHCTFLYQASEIAAADRETWLPISKVAAESSASLVIVANLLATDDTSPPVARSFIRRDQAERVISSLAKSCIVAQAATMLGCSSMDCRLMIKYGLLQRIGKRMEAPLHSSDRVSISEIENLKAKVRKRASSRKPGMTSMHRAAAMMKISRVRVLQMVLDGEFANVGFDASGGSAIFRSVVVDTSELNISARDPR